MRFDEPFGLDPYKADPTFMIMSWNKENERAELNSEQVGNTLDLLLNPRHLQNISVEASPALTNRTHTNREDASGIKERWEQDNFSLVAKDLKTGEFNYLE